MYFRLFFMFFLTLCILNAESVTTNKAPSISQMSQKSITPPKAEKNPLKITLHGDTRIDNYAWLKDPKWPEVKEPKILDYLKLEKSYTEAFFKPLITLQEELYQELKGRIQEEDCTYPIKNGDYLYYDRTEQGKDYTIHCRKKGENQKEEILLDENELAQGNTFFNLGIFELSHDHQLLAYATDTSGRERYTLRIRDLKTGNLLPDVLENTLAGTIIWHKKRNGFFYVGFNEKWRADRVFFHTLGEPQSKDLLIYQEKDETFSSAEKSSLHYSADRRYAFFEFCSSDTQEGHYIDLESDSLIPHLVIPRKKGHIYTTDHLKGYFYILTNDKGSNFRLVKTAVDKLGANIWEELIPHNDLCYLINFSLYQDHLVLKQMEDGLTKITVSPINNITHREEVPFKKEASYEANIEFTRYEDSFLRINYTSLATPETIYEYNLNTKELHLRKTKQILGGFDTKNYQVERIKAPSKDGTLVPISLVYKKSLKKEKGGNPLLLDGYGAYGISNDASFSFKRMSLLDRGFIVAIAHIRGGSEMGYHWYEDGKLLNKKHTFEDFIACSEHLIEKGYTTKKNIALFGGSAGGILMGYCANERPDLYRAIVARVPFVDVLNTMLNGDLPLTPGEYKEWGNPKEEPYYTYIKSYSPYDNVKVHEYPHMYVTGGLNDPRVTYWEPTKWVAKLRELKTDHNILLLDMKIDAGHFGSSGRFSYLKDEAAKYYAFLLTVFDIKDDQTQNNKFWYTPNAFYVKLKKLLV